MISFRCFARSSGVISFPLQDHGIVRSFHPNPIVCIRIIYFKHDNLADLLFSFLNSLSTALEDIQQAADPNIS